MWDDVIPVTCHPKKDGTVIHRIGRRWGMVNFLMQTVLLIGFLHGNRAAGSSRLAGFQSQGFWKPWWIKNSCCQGAWVLQTRYIYTRIYWIIHNYSITMKIKVKQTYIQIYTHSIHVFRSAQFACLFGKRSSLNQSLPNIFPVSEVSFNILAVPYARTQLATQIMFLGCTMLCRVAIFDTQFLLDFQPRVGETLKRTCWTMTKRTTALPVFLNPCTASAIVYPGIHIVHPKSLITRTGNLS